MASVRANTKGVGSDENSGEFSNRIAWNCHRATYFYVPRGVYHDAETLDEPSIHITITLLARRGARILKILSEKVHDDPFFGQLLPWHFENDEVKSSFKVKFKEACHELIDKMDLDEILDEMSTNFKRKRSRSFQGALRDALVDNQLSESSIVQKRTNVPYTRGEDHFFLTVEYYNQINNVPKPLASVLDYILGEEAFAIADISEKLNEKSKLNLIKPFIAGGLLRVVKC